MIVTAKLYKLVVFHCSTSEREERVEQSRKMGGVWISGRRWGPMSGGWRRGLSTHDGLLLPQPADKTV